MDQSSGTGAELQVLSGPWESCPLGLNSNEVSNNAIKPWKEFDWAKLDDGPYSILLEYMAPLRQYESNDSDNPRYRKRLIELTQDFWAPSEESYAETMGGPQARQKAFKDLSSDEKRLLMKTRSQKKRIVLGDIHQRFEKHCMTYAHDHPTVTKFSQVLDSYTPDIIRKHLQDRIRSGSLIPYGPCSLPSCVHREPHLPHSTESGSFYPESNSDKGISQRVVATLALWSLHRLFHLKVKDDLTSIFDYYLRLHPDLTFIDLLEQLFHSPFCLNSLYDPVYLASPISEEQAKSQRGGPPFGLAFFHSPKGLAGNKYPPPLWVSQRLIDYFITECLPKSIIETDQDLYHSLKAQISSGTLVEPWQIEAFPSTGDTISSTQARDFRTRAGRPGLTVSLQRLLIEFVNYGFSPASIDDINMTLTQVAYRPHVGVFDDSVVAVAESERTRPESGDKPRPKLLVLAYNEPETPVQLEARNTLSQSRLLKKAKRGAAASAEKTPNPDGKDNNDHEDEDDREDEVNRGNEEERAKENLTIIDEADYMLPEFQNVMQIIAASGLPKDISQLRPYNSDATIANAFFEQATRRTTETLASQLAKNKVYSDHLLQMIVTEQGKIAGSLRERYMCSNQRFWEQFGRGDAPYWRKQHHFNENDPRLSTGNRAAHAPLALLDADVTSKAAINVYGFFTTYGVNWEVVTGFLFPWTPDDRVRPVALFLFPGLLRTLVMAFLDLRAAIISFYITQAPSEVSSQYGYGNNSTLVVNKGHRSYSCGPMAGFPVEPGMVSWVSKQYRNMEPAQFLNSILSRFVNLDTAARNDAERRYLENGNPEFPVPDDLYTELIVAIKLMRWDMVEFMQAQSGIQSHTTNTARWWETASFFQEQSGGPHNDARTFLQFWFARCNIPIPDGVDGT